MSLNGLYSVHEHDCAFSIFLPVKNTTRCPCAFLTYFEIVSSRLKKKSENDLFTWPNNSLVELK